MIKKQKTLLKNKFRRKILVGHTFNLSLIGDPKLTPLPLKTLSASPVS